jgi:hypothetical protein
VCVGGSVAFINKLTPVLVCPLFLLLAAKNALFEEARMNEEFSGHRAGPLATALAFFCMGC